jgi:hypothetical protein
MLDVLLLYGHDAKETMLQSEMYFKDLAGSMDSVPGGGNSGLEYRFILTKKGYDVELEGPIHHNLFQNGLEVNIKLFPSSNAFLLMTGTVEKYKAHIT